MKFVDRIEESKRLEKVLNAEKPTFTVVYGRRRLGKSTLLTRVLGKNDVYYLADATEANLQRELLAKMIAAT
ncbi:MAG: ATP-binding protein, partial [Rikenellaceae bacterium]|nr:ATP-binding protein [Rikenellaceae bacterium]